MRQKMEFPGDSAAGLIGPEDPTLMAYFKANPQLFARPAKASFRQVLLGDATDAEVAAVRAVLDTGAGPEALGRRSLLPDEITQAGRPVVDRTFGDGFLHRATALNPSRWAGPIRSAYGLHLVRLDALDVGGAPDFESVRATVEDAWRRSEASLPSQAMLMTSS